MENTKNQYDIIKGNGNDAELERYKICFLNNDSEKSLNVLKWFHQKNLRRVNSIYYAIDRETQNIASIYTYLPLILKCMGKVINGMQSFDTLTDKNHRAKGLFIKLASKIEKEEGLKNNELVFGFPNENSVHGFVNKLGFNYFGEVPFLIKPLKISYFINIVFKNKVETISQNNCIMNIASYIKIKPNVEIREILEFNQSYEDLYDLASPQIKIGVNRNAEYMNWRYVMKPDGSYARYGLYENNQLKGVIVFTLKNKHNGKIGYLMELIYAPQDKNAGKLLLKFCTKTLKKSNADLILAWCFSHSFNYKSIRSNGYYRFPEKLRPQKLGFIAKTLNGKNTEDIYNIKNWYLSYSDSDTV